MVVGEASIHNIMGGMESTGGVRLHNHKRKLKQRFDIIKKLGQGTYGKVQLGINKETGQEVAIKTIKKCKIETEADLIRIRREIQIMSSVQHPNIIHIYEVFENREKMVLVMEYAAGGELYDYLSERKVLAEEEARRIFRQISIAVFYCHKHKICHRDLKLENILLDQSGNAKIADFGLSNVFDDHRLLNTFCGSPLYASPEIVKGTPYHGPEVDCWSLGVLLYTLVYGAMPFDGSNFKRLTRQISASDYFEPKCPSPASPLIKDMLTKCPSRRADIERICCHWWVNEGYDQNCLDIAEDLAAQTPVRLDLLLSLVPQSASADKLVVGDPRPEPPVSNMSSETLAPTRCHSVGSLMELDRSTDDKLRDIVEGMEEERSAPGDTKRKLELTPSMEETVAAGTKKKERSRRKEKDEDREREPRAYKSSSRHHSAPIGASITEEPMEVDLRDPESADALLEMLKEVQEQERSKTPVGTEPNYQNAEIKVGEEKSPKLGAKGKQIEMETAAAKGIVDGNGKEAGTEVQGFYSKDKSQSEEKRVKTKASDEEPAVGPAKPTERRRSKIFETAEKFNQLASSASMEPDKAKKIFIPGVNVGGAKRAFERKASLSSIAPSSIKQNSKVADIDKTMEKGEEKAGGNEGAAKGVELAEEERKREEEKKRAVDIIAGALGKPPIKKALNGSPPLTPQTPDPRRVGLKIQVGPNDVRNATISITTPVDEKYPEFEVTSGKPVMDHSVVTSPGSKSLDTSLSEEPTMSSKIEITLKSATLPRQRKTSKAEIVLSGFKPPYKSEVEAKIDAFHPQKLRTQRSEVAFPVGGIVPQANRSASLEPENRGKPSIKERIIPISVEQGHQSPPPHAKPPMPQRSLSQKSGSLSRQSTADSDTDSALGSTVGPEPIRKSPREYIIPIAVEGGGYVTPRSGSLEPESKGSTPTTASAPRSKFGRPRRMGSLLSDASEDESPFSTLHRDSDDLLQRHMHRLRSSRPSKQAPEHADSLSSGEDDDDDGFELLTAENLFSTLLSRVRSLTQRLNVDDNRGTGFPRSRLLERLGSNSSQGFWGMHEPLSRRMAETPFRRSMSRDTDRFGRKDSAMSSNPATPNSLGRSTPSRESMFDAGSSNTLPRDKNDDSELDLKMIKELQEEQDEDKKFTPCLARRLSRQFIEKTRLSLPRSPSIPRERLLRSSTEEPLSLTDLELSMPSYRSRSSDRSLRRTGSLLESSEKPDRATRRSVSLFEDNDDPLPPLPRQVMTLGRKYRDQAKSPSNGIRRDSFQTQKIQEEPTDLLISPKKKDSSEQGLFISEGTSTNLGDTPSTSKSGETSPTDSSSRTQEDSFSSFKAHAKEFESRLLAAENLIKESKLRNLGITKFDPNLSSSYRDTDKCDKELLGSMSDLTSSVLSKRRSCIPSLRLRSGSLTREASTGRERRETLDDTSLRSSTPERSLLSKFFRSSSTTREADTKDKSPKTRRKISRFLRPDFFDTPREESQYVKEKEAQKAAENERRKSRFIRRKIVAEGNNLDQEKNEKQEKELKNQANTLTREIDEKISKNNKIEGESRDAEVKSERQSPKNSFLQSLERKLERLRSSDETKMTNGSPQKEIMENLTAAEGNLSSPGELRKAASAEDLPAEEPQSSPVAPTKSKVSSVLGLFKNDSKSSVNGNKQQNTLLSKFRKNTYKGSRSDTSVIAGETPGGSKIPMKSKLESKTPPKLAKTHLERKKSADKISESKKSPPKEKSKEKSPPKDKAKEKTPSERSSVERKPISDKSAIKSPKKLSPEKSIDSKSDKSDKSLSESRKSVDKLDNKTTVRLSSPKKISPDKALDNKKSEGKISEDGKPVVKKKVGKSLTAGLSKNGSVSRLDKPEEEKIKKVIVKKEIVEREGEDGTKKRIIRVVKKVVKKSEISDKKSDDKTKDKPLRSLSLKKIGLKKEKSPETVLNKSETPDESSKELPPKKTNCVGNYEESPEKNRIKPEIGSEEIRGDSPPSVGKRAPSHSLVTDCQEIGNSVKVPGKIEEIISQGTSPVLTASESSSRQDSVDVKSRVNRGNLKLDLSKVPQHSFKPPSGLKRESPPGIHQVNPPDQTRTESRGENRTITPSYSLNERGREVVSELPKILNPQSDIEVPSGGDLSRPRTALLRPKASSEVSEELLSPTDDCESFDSWSICSNDLNRCSSDFHSPTSPTYCPPGRDHSESIIDRIRRKSFYSRFNERKRKSSLTASPSSISSSPLPTSSTLPRKFSFNSSRDRLRHSERPVTLYNDDHLRFRKSPIERDRYSDVGAYSGDFEHLRRYRISPTPDPAHRKYQSSDLSFEHDLGMYKSSFPSSTLSDPVSDYRVLGSLGRKYGSLGGGIEPKTAEYYEELLAPTRMEYLTRRTPVPGEGKGENGYVNGHAEDVGEKWRNFPEKGALDSTDESDRSIGDDGRRHSKTTNEVKELSAACPDAEATASIVE
ncbi:serine/arginine repetitive matrix protein 2 [Fopius arisanus]|uniref:Serine/arginine repetitive matrix protein 2 n=1 Tax=Fopius arisanus TaxID=64838 RepID=A0A9R1TE77_9HYME|nr:PREDICTED: serine/arginine repetitive matrix protein 2 [Fopius arisanus]